MITTDCALAGHLDAIRPGPSMRSTPSSPLQVERSSVAASRVPSCPWHAQPSSGPQVVSHTVAAACVRASAHQALVSGVAQTPFRPHVCASSCCTASFPWHALRTGSDASVEDRRQRKRLKRRARISNPIEKRSTGSPSNTVSTSFTSSTRASTSCFPRPGNNFLCSGRRGWSSATSEHEASSSRFFAACLGVRVSLPTCSHAGGMRPVVEFWEPTDGASCGPMPPCCRRRCRPTTPPVPDALCLPSRRYEANTSTLLQARRKRTRLALPSVAASGGNPANPAPALVYSPAADTSQPGSRKCTRGSRGQARDSEVTGDPCPGSRFCVKTYSYSRKTVLRAPYCTLPCTCTCRGQSDWRKLCGCTPYSVHPGASQATPWDQTNPGHVPALRCERGGACRSFSWPARLILSRSGPTAVRPLRNVGSCGWRWAGTVFRFET
ncbi:hypothetical protein VFPFJ_00959 [Purpureocillium lilacinum]|uniref:Uncharacterized protein n=1 Tax=Purpureocillium lilacinum TaxID=33203 RepID=A0A179HZT7_PURLI|nr:hypothetical protein VFPFJ_00959 [Purpureocillium lilacinum]OAQ94850.1 hypothetical protein VFPFJ_00959 [Purpureocillium lilacinum]